MTVKELKEVLNNYTDDMPVLYWNCKEDLVDIDRLEKNTVEKYNDYCYEYCYSSSSHKTEAIEALLIH